MKKKRFLTLGLAALLSVISLAGCTNTVGQVVEPGVVAHNIGIQRAFGENGKQTLNLVFTPSNADTGVITWSVDRTDGVNITPINNGRSAEISIINDRYFATYATISVHEEFSDITATGKVYSYAKTAFGSYGGSWDDSRFDNKGSVLIISEDNSTELPTSNHWAHMTNAEIATGKIQEEAGWAHTAAPKLDWIMPNDHLYLHMIYKGSYSPLIFVERDDPHAVTFYNLDDLVPKEHTGGAAGMEKGREFSIKLDLYEGTNLIGIVARDHTVIPTDLTGVTSVNDLEENRTVMTAFRVVRALGTSGITVPDLTFYE